MNPDSKKGILPRLSWGKFLILLAFMVICVGIYFAYNTGYVVIKVDNSSGQDVRITIESQEGSDQISIQSGGSIRQRLSSGQHEIFAETTTGRSWVLVESPHFLKSNRYSISISPEYGRQYIGNNPEECMEQVMDTLLSYECGGLLETINIHTVATATAPTYKKAVENAPQAIIEHMSLKGNSVNILARAGDDEAPYHAYFTLDIESGTFNEGSLVTKLIPGEIYTSSPYKQGAILYNDSLTSLFYVSETNELAAIEPINNETNLEPHRLASQGETIVRVYSEIGTEYTPEGPDEDGTADKTLNEIYVTRPNRESLIHIDGIIVNALPCGTNKLCVTKAGSENSNSLIVYDIADDEAKELYSFPGVDEAFSTNDKKLLTIKDGGIWEFDIDRRTGAQIYKFDDYAPCGVRVGLSHILACIKYGDVLSVLSLDQSKQDKNIDKQILSLSQKPGISRVSAYKQFIFATSKVPTIFTDHGFDFDPAKQQEARKRVSDYAREIGIDTNRSTIINLAE